MRLHNCIHLNNIKEAASLVTSHLSGSVINIASGGESILRFTSQFTYIHIPDVKCYSLIFDRVQVQNISLSDSEFLDFYFIRFYFCKQISMTMKHTVILLHATTHHINHSFKGNEKLSKQMFLSFLSNSLL